MGTTYTIKLLFANTRLKLNVPLLYKDEQDTSVNVLIYKGAGEVDIEFYYYPDEVIEMLKRLDAFVENEVREGSNTLLAVDYGGLEPWTENLSKIVKCLPIDEAGKLKSLDKHLLA